MWNRAEFSSNNFFTGQKNNYLFKTHLLSGQGTDCTSWAQSIFPNMGFGRAERYNPKWAPVRQPSWGQPGECAIWLEPSLAPVGFSTRVISNEREIVILSELRLKIVRWWETLIRESTRFRVKWTRDLSYLNAKYEQLRRLCKILDTNIHHMHKEENTYIARPGCIEVDRFCSSRRQPLKGHCDTATLRPPISELQELQINYY